MRFAVDTGDTCTDVLLEGDQGAVRVFEVPTTASDAVDGIIDAIGVAAERTAIRSQESQELLAAGDVFIDGTTHAINAVIIRRTARAALHFPILVKARRLVPDTGPRPVRRLGRRPLRSPINDTTSTAQGGRA